MEPGDVLYPARAREWHAVTPRALCRAPALSFARPFCRGGGDLACCSSESKLFFFALRVPSAPLFSFGIPGLVFYEHSISPILA